ncbi:STAS domain-containing protein [Nocardia sp. GCM10030253]|uniref:STAS domain-containing protein n=1 Tax=Nocardia sp. GCM10030253 TaxID=3273404 RepID=UPI00363F74FD
MASIPVLQRRAGQIDANGSGPRPRERRLWTQQSDQRRHCVIVRVEGELDAAVNQQFHRLLDDAVGTRCDAVVVDLRATQFLGIRVAAALASAKAMAWRNGLDLRVVTGCKDVERALEIAGVRPLFCRYPTMRAALDA